MKAEPRLQRPRSTYIEYLEKRIAPATFVVTNLNDSGPGSLRQAVIDANADPGADTIVFKGAATSGEIALTSGEIAITDSVNIKGPGTGRLIIDAQDLSRIFNINDGTATVKRVTISGLSMVRGSSASEGGGIFSTESLTLVNSVVSGCDSLNDGGGVYVKTGGRVLIQNCTISANTAGGRGGGLYLGAAAGIQVLNSTITGNSSGQEGGGVYAFIDTDGTGDILIANSTITNNSAIFGGGVAAENAREVRGVIVGKVIVRGSTVSGNDAVIVGGGLYFDDGRVLVDRSVISNNVAGQRGGGIGENRCESLTIRGSQVINNSTTATFAGGGGGITILGNENVLIQRTVVTGNISADTGGGIVASESRVVLVATTISGNTAATAGGGVYATKGTLAINSSTIRDNRTTGAASGGGGVSTYGVGADKLDLRITNSLFTNNRASGAGGAVDTRGDGAVNILRSRFLQNTAGADGGGLYLRSYLGAISIASSVIARNTADSDGGGLAVRQPGAVPILITSTLFDRNVATGGNGGGVVIFGSGGIVTFTRATITGNVADVQGGGLRAVPIVGVDLNGSRITGNTAPTAPQIYAVTTT